MKNVLIYGTPAVVSAARSLVTAFTTGGGVVLAMLRQTQDPILLLSAGGTAFLIVIGARFGVEGNYLDRGGPTLTDPEKAWLEGP